ncbi:MAG: 2,3-bisphosphoglycerate-independent phosphoglycerate mutase [bacterium]|nr:2,3-bisphosphoglycerate-independent phosphoglycerate mutase [bacterium]
MNRPKPVILIICDGFGVAPDADGNAVRRSHMPYFDRLIQSYPAMTLQASAGSVGLSWGEMGNSEVGHLTIGAGRIFYQSFPRISMAIETGDFLTNPALLGAIEHVKKTGGTLHFMGLVSPGNVHASDSHLHALLELASKNKVKDVAVHAFLDGRDAIFNSGVQFIQELEEKMKSLKVGRIASLCGRYWAMDRDNRWDRIQTAYDAIVLGQSKSTAKKAVDAIKASYKAEVYDEQFYPTVITDNGVPEGPMKEGDACVFFNFRPDRARELTRAFVLPTFESFPRKKIDNLYFVTCTEYEKDLPVKIAFPPQAVETCLADVISKAGLKQLHIAETEKYAHVTFFLNGTREDEFPGEDRIIIPSPRVSTYDKAPEMSAGEITDKVVQAIAKKQYDFIVLNYANPDMVSHTGDETATIKAMEAVDKGIGKIVDATLGVGGVVLITADHGNAEEVKNLQTGEIDKEHSTNPVPFLIIGKAFEGKKAPSGDVIAGDLSLTPPVGMLADVAPTVLKIMGLEKPEIMTGTPLV